MLIIQLLNWIINLNSVFDKMTIININRWFGRLGNNITQVRNAIGKNRNLLISYQDDLNT